MPFLLAPSRNSRRSSPKERCIILRLGFPRSPALLTFSEDFLMPRKASFQPHLVLFVLVAVFISLATNPAVAGTEATLHNFAAQGHGAAPQGGLISDAAGNLYGVSATGGAYNSGTEATLHNFAAQGHGAAPQGGLISDAAGNLYGVSATGGAYNSGTVFEFVPNQQGGWDQKILYTFKGGSDGLYPEGQLVFDGAGNLYGTTYWGGKAGSCISGGCGTIFELKHNPDGSWTESILKTFDNDKYGGDLEYGLVFDKAGNLYGTSWVGGANQGGIVFELSPSTDGTWTETILY